MTFDDRPAVLHLYAESEHIRDKLRVLRPHVWPQPSSVSAQHMCCLHCGARFWGRRAEGPCEPRGAEAAKRKFVPR
jgi:hypothetical protein